MRQSLSLSRHRNTAEFSLVGLLAGFGFGLSVGLLGSCTPTDTQVASAGPNPDQLKTEYVVLVTTDGLRHQELFHGADPTLMDPANLEMSGAKNLDRLRANFWRDSDVERRTALMPFFWGELVKHGLVLGDLGQDSAVVVKNEHWFSYPGYAEILTGAPQPTISSNANVPSPAVTALEVVHRERTLGFHDVAAIASWEVIARAAESTPGTFFTNAGFSHMPAELLDEKTRIIDSLQDDIKTPWDDVRHDAVTLPLGLHYLKTKQPRLFYLSLAETDDWAHMRRYDRTLQAAHHLDRSLRALWTTLQSMDKYRDKTTLIFTTDHGRGRTLQDWKSHRAEIPGSNEIFIGVFGPDTPNQGVMRATAGHTQGQVAATILKFFGLERSLLDSRAARPIVEAFPQTGK